MKEIAYIMCVNKSILKILYTVVVIHNTTTIIIVYLYTIE